MTFLDGNLNSILSDIVDGIAPVIQLPNGLFTTLNLAVSPSTNLGTNLEGSYTYNGTNPIILLGTWSSSGMGYYAYDDESGTWSFKHGLL